MSSKSRPTVISTGNILTVNKKAGQKPIEELLDCLKTTFSEQVTSEQQRNGDDAPAARLLARTDAQVQVVEEGSERSQVKIGAKIFLNQYSTANLRWALDQLYRVLNVDHLDNLILAYHPTSSGQPATNGNGTAAATNGSAESEKDAVQQWGSGNATAQADLIALWRVLEEYAVEKRITQLGIADLDVNSLQALFEGATARPAIAQINLQACCVVPPALQEFCNQNDIQLLTHSDPDEILTKTMLDEVAGDSSVGPIDPVWTVRYQVHLKCRGVLTVKGYLVGAQ